MSIRPAGEGDHQSGLAGPKYLLLLFKWGYAKLRGMSGLGRFFFWPFLSAFGFRREGRPKWRAVLRKAGYSPLFLDDYDGQNPKKGRSRPGSGR